MDAKTKSQFIRWYEANKRDLPWRKSKNPYSIWISEMMLQQTTVKAVLPYFDRFLKTFPDVTSLADAREEKVLSLWSGLGYYSRARNIHKAAKEIQRLGIFPKTYSKLIELSGIGPYTGAAIASIAYDEPIACVDGNVIRVITRLYDIEKNVISKEGRKLIAQKAQELISHQPPSMHNQAMMELGATICTPRNPSCLLCPLHGVCISRKKGTIESRPVKNKRKAQEPWLWTLYFIEKRGRLALVKNNKKTPWLKNTWVLPGHAGAWKKKSIPSSHFRHSITHHKIFVRCVEGKLHHIKNLTKSGELCWIKKDEIEKLGLSSVVLKAIQARKAKYLEL